MTMVAWDDDIIQPRRRHGGGLLAIEGLRIRVRKKGPEGFTLRISIGRELRVKTKWIKGDRVTIRFSRADRLMLVQRVTAKEDGWMLRAYSSKKKKDSAEYTLYTDIGDFCIPVDLRQTVRDLYGDHSKDVEYTICSDGVYFRLDGEEIK